MIYNKYIEILFILFFFSKNFILFLINKNKFLSIKNFCNEVSRLNIVYIKIFQSISINSSLFDKKTQDFLIQFTDQVPFNNSDIDYDALINIKKYIDIEATPINSGIFALVYKGKYNNKNMAIKILKKNIKSRLYNCIDNLKIILYISTFIPIIKKLNLYTFLIKNKNNLINQTSLCNESKNLKNFKNSINDEYIIVPEIYDEFTQDNIIVMDFIEGRKITDLDPKEYHKYGTILFNIYLGKTNITNYLHADLHVGNILFMKDKICILDFGLVTYVEDKYALKYFEFLYSSIINEDYDFIYNNLHYFINVEESELEKKKKNYLNLMN